MASSTTAAERGQSLLEFVLLLPVMVGMLILMVRISSSVQVSIVNQKYSRLRIFEFTDNAPYYPKIDFFRRFFLEQNANRMVIGVSDQPVSGESVEPDASTVKINSSRQVVGSNEARAEPDLRSEVRVRNTVEICTSLRVSGGKEIKWSEASLRNLTSCRSGSS